MKKAAKSIYVTNICNTKKYEIYINIVYIRQNITTHVLYNFLQENTFFYSTNKTTRNKECAQFII